MVTLCQYHWNHESEHSVTWNTWSMGTEFLWKSNFRHSSSWHLVLLEISTCYLSALFGYWSTCPLRHLVQVRGYSCPPRYLVFLPPQYFGFQAPGHWKHLFFLVTDSSCECVLDFCRIASRAGKNKNGESYFCDPDGLAETSWYKAFFLLRWMTPALILSLFTSVCGWPHLAGCPVFEFTVEV